MKFSFYLSLGWEIFLWTFISLIVIAIILFLLFKFVFVGRSTKKQFRQLSKRYEIARSTLLNKDTQHLRRIEAISDVNLLMRPTYTELYNKFTDLREIDDRRSQKALQTLNEALIKGPKDFRKIYPENRNIIIDYETKVMKLDEELTRIISPESESREKSVVFKEKYRQLKHLFRDNRFELTLVETSFNKIFIAVEQLFKDYDNALNGAYYEEANTALTKIEAILEELERALKVLPLLCVKTTKLLPKKISDLDERHVEMEQEGYPLQNLLINKQIETFNEQLKAIEKSLQQFQTNNVDQTLNEIDASINELFERMDFEVSQKELYDREFEKSYADVNETEHKYIWLINMMPKIKNVYLISQEKEQELIVLKSAIDAMSNSKRTLDNFIHSSTKQPYSLLVEYMVMMQEETEKVKVYIDEYVTFVNALRIDSEFAYKLISDTYFRLKSAELVVREINVDVLTTKVDPQFDKVYDLADQINDTLRRAPIDVMLVRSLTSDFEEEATVLINYVDEQASFARLAEKAILKLNQYRNKMTDMQALGVEVERLFYAGHFEEAYKKTVEPLARFIK